MKHLLLLAVLALAIPAYAQTDWPASSLGVIYMNPWQMELIFQPLLYTREGQEDINRYIECSRFYPTCETDWTLTAGGKS